MNEKDFAQNLKPWLERAAGGVGDLQATRLKAARLRALDAYREPVRLLGLVTMNAGTAQMIHYTIFQRALLLLPLLALLAVLAFQSLSSGDTDLGDLDAAAVQEVDEALARRCLVERPVHDHIHIEPSASGRVNSKRRALRSAGTSRRYRSSSG